jgi:hypothetical protein
VYLLSLGLHKISHGWPSSSSTFCKTISEVINSPDQDITFPRYRADGEKKAEMVAFQPMIFHALVLGALISFFIFFFL